MNISKIDIAKPSEAEINDLEEILQKSDEATIFHTSEWNQILIETFGVNNMTFVAKKDGRPLGLYIVYYYLNSGPRIICRSPDASLEAVYGGPIVINDLNNKTLVRKSLIQETELQAKTVMVQISMPPGINPEFLNDLGYIYTPFYTSILCLNRSEEELFNSIHPYARNRIRKAQKSRVEIVKEGREYLAEYYEMTKETLESQGVKVKPRNYYEKVLDRLGPSHKAKLFVAMYNGKPISGAIFLFYKDTVYYWHGASFNNYLFVSPNNLLHWELIKYGHQNGYKKYDFLNIEPNRLPGIARFKMRFGGETKAYYRASGKTPFYRFPLLTYYLKHPSYVYKRIMARLL